MSHQDLWFKRKRFGWGWTPINAKGWAVVAAYVVPVLGYPILSEMGFFEFSKMPFLFFTAVMTAAHVFICYKKGEKPQWSWG